MKGLTQVYTGKGKGKTTAAMGLALRALGRGKRVCIVQFLKKEGGSGETEAMKKFPGVRILYTGGEFNVLRPLSQERKSRLQKELSETLSECKKILEGGEYDIVILDEIKVAMSKGLANIETVLEVMDSKPENVELVLTGRNATKEVIDRADLVTQMEDIKHPYRNGIKAREGIDY